jgi:thiol-disulfide isomerase/thioredoxin
MKRNWLLSISLVLTVVLSAVTNKSIAQEGYELRFKINGLKDSLVHIANYYGEKQYLKDSAYADANGNILFKGAESLPGGIYLFVFPNKTYFEFLIDKEQKFNLECQMGNVIETMKIKGSNDNVLFYEYLKFIQDRSKEVEPLKAQRKAMADNHQPTDSLDEKIKAIDKLVIDFKTNFINTHPDCILSAIFKGSQDPEVPELPIKPDGSRDSAFAYYYYRNHYFDKLDLSDERLLRSPIYHNKLQYFTKNLMIQIPDSIIPMADMLVNAASRNKETFKYMVWFLTNTYETSNIMGMDQVFVHLVKNYYTKEKAYWVDETTLYKINDRARILEPILLGKKVKNLILTDSSGVYQALYNVNTPYTILYFWDPDCGHCKKATPKVKAYYDKVKSKGVQVYAVCTEVEMEKWKNYIKENKLDWINVADPKLQNNFREEFDIKTTPQIFILDKDKKILAKKIDEETLEKIMDKELENAAKKK